ncbi:DUF5958 family protein [Spirosoma fluminis]
MSLEEEIQAYQFAQGVRSEADLVSRFNKEDEELKAMWLFDVSSLLFRLGPFDADTEQFISTASMTPTDPGAQLIRRSSYQGGHLRFVLDTSGNGLVKSHETLPIVFKAVYERITPSESDKSIKWWYWDLSCNEVVQAILTRHQDLVEATYTNPDYRSEFNSIAKLWNERHKPKQPKADEPAPDIPGKFTFVTYDEVMTAHTALTNNKPWQGIRVLTKSLSKALVKRHTLDSDSADRIVWDVVERHLRETYHTDLRSG